MPAPLAPTTYGTAGVNTAIKAFGGSTGNLLAALKPLVYGEKIHKWWKDLYPTASIVMKVGRRPTPSPVFYEFDQQEPPHWIKTPTANATVTLGAGGQDLGATVFAGVDNHKRITLNDTWTNTRTKETVLVIAKTTDGATDTITCVRKFGRVAGQPVLAGDYWVKGLPAFAEGAQAPGAIFTAENQDTFYACESMMSSMLTWRLAATRMQIEPNTRERLIEDARFRFTDAWKRSYFVGGQGLSQATYADTTGVRGLVEHISTNTMYIPGRPTRSDIFGFISEQVAPYNMNQTLLMATSARILGVVNDWAMERLEVPPSIKEWGVEIDSFRLMGNRKVALVEERWLSESDATSGWAFIIPVEESKWRPVVGNDINGEMTLYRDTVKSDLNTYYKDVWYQFGGWAHGPERQYGFIQVDWA